MFYFSISATSILMTSSHLFLSAARENQAGECTKRPKTCRRSVCFIRKVEIVCSTPQPRNGATFSWVSVTLTQRHSHCFYSDRGGSIASAKQKHSVEMFDRNNSGREHHSTLAVSPGGRAAFPLTRLHPLTHHQHPNVFHLQGDADVTQA